MPNLKKVSDNFLLLTFSMSEYLLPITIFSTIKVHDWGKNKNSKQNEE